ncbi:major facilitator superfamily domain-containing protein [Polychytrium aggregatum]|uniref:major facilitator superfamily domain-containing protein n=1 Tax=Polychytrium aggregatum TaxID=110093 RepID=UPI0022FE30F2|nr:major facilitator superfamily domain-containing protein [Polychytrium aggregatum]KAI9203160.1 major facilitator superfamily domain-containing protein [Polychytrium aggregatum]
MAISKAPIAQVVLLGLICFGCPGMFNAVNNLGAGGGTDPTTGSNANAALYTTFAIFGLFGGAINNILGPRIQMFIGGLTYSLYIGASLNNDVSGGADGPAGAKAFFIIAGAILGVGAGLLWSSQGALIMAYPTEEKKATYFAIFWIIFNLGSVFGNTVGLILNFNNPDVAISNGTFGAFIGITILGSCCALLLADPKTVVRADGTPVEVITQGNIIGEAIEVLKLFGNWRMLLMAPCFLASNYFYAYQFNYINGHFYNVRSGSFNGALYWAFQAIGSYVISKFLDNEKWSRHTRSRVGLAVVFIGNAALWIGAIIYQQTAFNDVAPGTPLGKTRVDLFGTPGQTHPAMWGITIMYVLMAALDAMFQSYAYWIMGALTNDYATLSRYGGFYKGIQSFGGAISWIIGGVVGAPVWTQLIITVVLVIGSLPIAYATVNSVKDTSKADDEASKAAAKA